MLFSEQRQNGLFINQSLKMRNDDKARYALLMTVRCLDENIVLNSEIATEISDKIGYFRGWRQQTL